MPENKALLLFTISPVQSFITASRKTNDLLAGSLLLSGLAGAAIETVTANGGRIIFPYIKDAANIKNNRSLPNRFLAEVPAKRAEEIALLAEKSILDRQNNSGYVHDLAQKYKKRTEDASYSANPHWNNEWINQTNNYWEIYWGIKILPDDEADINANYGMYYNELENSVGFRKTVRNFNQFIQEGIKCNLFPEFSSVFPLNHKNNYKDAKAFFREEMWGKKKNFRYSKGEMLSSIGILKREYSADISASFPSTANLANGTFMESAVNKYQSDPGFRSLVEEYVTAYAGLRKTLDIAPSENYRRIKKGVQDKTLLEFIKSDNSFLMKEIKSPEMLAKIYEADGLDAGVYNNYSKALKKLLENSDESPSAYYAVIYFDGDEMGKWLSGTHVNSKGEQLKITPLLHNQISEALTGFAAVKAPKVVEEDNLAQLLFSGGDDVIAFAPLNSLLKLFKDIHESFANTMFDAANKFMKGTGSFGVCIAHHNHSLSEVLNEARSAEHYAKSTLGRNAFAITVLKHSGEKETAGARFDDGYKVIAFLQKYFLLLKEEFISSSFLYSIMEELKNISGLNKPELLLSILSLELKQHSNKEIKKKSLTEENINEFKRLFEELIKKDYSFTSLLDLLKTVQFISRGGN